MAVYCQNRRCETRSEESPKQKISISAVDVTRFIVENGERCLLFGHFEYHESRAWTTSEQKLDWVDFIELEEDFLTNKSTCLWHNWSKIIRDFIFSPPARVPSLKYLDEAEDFIGILSVSRCLLEQIISFSTPNFGFNQSIFSRSELECFGEFDEDRDD